MTMHRKLLLIAAQVMLLASGLALGQELPSSIVYDTIGNGVTAPKAVYAPNPEYTDRARKQKINGSVIVSMIVGPEGTVHEPKVATGLDKDLDKQALKAVSSWKFKPATKDGNPVAFRTKVEVTFRLY